MKLKDILVSANIDIEVTGISYNSKVTKPGDVFVAITGFQTDGHKYINNAVENGAVCVVCERPQENLEVPYFVVENSRKALAEMSCNFYNNPTKKFNLIGVTGTNGKTTVTYLVKTILETVSIIPSVLLLNHWNCNSSSQIWLMKVVHTV